MKTKIAIVGSRKYQPLEKIEKVLNEIKNKFEKEKIKLKIITGGANGVDETAMQWAHENKIELTCITPITKQAGTIKPNNKIRYLLRNVEIITKSDVIIAFWDGQSTGTKFVIEYAKQRGKHTEVIQ